MNLDNLNKWLTLSANIGVLAGIIFLAIELQQNTNMMRSQTRQAISESTNMANVMLASDASVAELMAKGAGGVLQPGGTAEWIQFSSIVQVGFRNWENEFYQYEQGLYEEAEFRTRQETLKSSFNRPGFRQVWFRNREEYSDRFREFVDQYLDEIEND